jgi:hypothetical protein
VSPLDTAHLYVGAFLWSRTNSSLSIRLMNSFCYFAMAVILRVADIQTPDYLLEVNVIHRLASVTYPLAMLVFLTWPVSLLLFLEPSIMPIVGFGIDARRITSTQVALDPECVQASTQDGFCGSRAWQCTPNETVVSYL